MPDSLHLTFSAQTGATLKKGPYKGFCLQGETMRETVGGKTFAVHEDHHWQVDGQRFSRADCDCHVIVHASRVDGKESKQYGPFDTFSCYDGIAYVNHAVFAFADRTIGDWYCHADGHHWAIIHVKAVD